MIANRALERAQLIARAIRDSGHEVASPWVLGPIENSDPSETNVFQRDKKWAEESDIIVADVSEPSIGVGMEIMAAYIAGRRIILVARKGKTSSRMLSHLDRKEVVEYDQDDEVYAGLMRLLSR